MSEMGDALRMAAQAALPPVEGELRLPGLSERVEVIRDRWGVPHIYAANEPDLFFAQGFVTASERLFQIEFLGRAGLGRLSELIGELGVTLDRFIRTVGWNRAAVRQADRWAQGPTDAQRAFAAGTRAWRERLRAYPPEYLVLGADPLVVETFEDQLLWGAAGQVLLSYTLSRNWDIELVRFQVAEQLGLDAVLELFPDAPPDPSVVQAGKFRGPSPLDLLRQAPPIPGGQGSNAWVVSGERTARGKPLLANDPHLLLQVPSVWFEVHLVCPTMNVSGVALPFAPGVIIGHNERIAWGFTNTEGDVMDLYLERLNEDRTAALHDGEWEPLTVHREEIHVRGRGEPEVVEVLETRHGPILDSYLVGVAEQSALPINETFALQWVGAEHGVASEAVLAMDRAADFESFRDAVRGWDCPGQNMVYADVDGNIGYQLTGRYPLRRRGDGSFPVPGWSSEYGWDGVIPFEELPWAYNPPAGFVATANTRPYDEAYPYVITRDWMPSGRVRRIGELITQTAVHTPETFAEIQVDTVSLTARATVPGLLRLEPSDERQKEALAALAAWDHDLAADSAPAAIFQAWCGRIAEAVLKPPLGEELFVHYYGRRHWANTFRHQVLPQILTNPTARWWGAEGADARDRVLRTALDAALDELTARLGDDPAAWRWGAMHTATFAGRLAIIPDLAELFTAGVIELGGDDDTVAQALYEPEAGYGVAVIPSWRQIIDLADQDASTGVHPPGQSGNPASPHFADLLALWAAGERHPIPLSRDRVQGIAATTLILEPEGA
ncbi:MAG: penicillin acylase family protein [Actinobacteria bacterium]|nr:penicillin acylase family protein [Actinomycetota bacterium]